MMRYLVNFRDKVGMGPEMECDNDVEVELELEKMINSL